MSYGIQGGQANATGVYVGGNTFIAPDKLLMIDAATKEEQSQVERVWVATNRLREIADSLFGAEPQATGDKGAMPAPSGRLYGLAEAQRNVNASLDALSQQISRFAQL